MGLRHPVCICCKTWNEKPLTSSYMLKIYICVGVCACVCMYVHIYIIYTRLQDLKMRRKAFLQDVEEKVAEK